MHVLLALRSDHRESWPAGLLTPCRHRAVEHRPAPSLLHVMPPGSLALAGVTGTATPWPFSLQDIHPHLRPLSSTGITRCPQSYGPLRHPAGPACPLRGSGWCVHTTDRASRVATVSPLHACRRHYPGGAGRCPRRSLPGRWQPSPRFCRVGFRIVRFEACSAFTRVAARMVTEPPKATLFHRSASGHVVASITRSDCYRLERQLPGGIRTR